MVTLTDDELRALGMSPQYRSSAIDAERAFNIADGWTGEEELVRGRQQFVPKLFRTVPGTVVRLAGYGTPRHHSRGGVAYQEGSTSTY